MKVRNVQVIALCASVFFLSGCSTSLWEAKWGHDKPHISFVSLDATKTQIDKLYVWNPNNNAAYVFQAGGVTTGACLASADVAKSRNYESEVKVDLGKVLDKIDSAKLEDKLKVIETVTKLTDKGGPASFLNVAMFHICMMAGAGKITSGEADALMSTAIIESAKLSK